MKSIYSLVTAVVIFSGVAGSAQAQNVKLHCSTATRLVAATLDVEFSVAGQYLGYALEKYHASEPSQNYELRGSNQEGFWNTVSFATHYDGKAEIVGMSFSTDEGTQFPHPNRIEVLLEKSPYAALGEYKLVSFKVRGIEHKPTEPATMMYCELSGE